LDELQKKEHLSTIRHSASHIMAQAVKNLFKDVKLAIGPSIENGFYYDFDLGDKITEKEFPAIEKEMSRISKEKLPFEQFSMKSDDAVKLFQEKGEQYKIELIQDLGVQEVSFYKDGDFVDLCKGPHVTNTGEVKHFKLLSVAGAYWRGSEKNKMLQRIYGTAFETKDELYQHLKNLEEAEKRDHRKLGRELDIFSINEKWGNGLILWHPNGAIIRNTIEEFWRSEHLKRGYNLIYTPHIANLDLWKQSGHWDYYRENMYSPIEIDDTQYVIKPMNCPGHILIFKNRIRSYRELPLRWAELGTVYRYERSGVLHGTLRVRGFTQDDAHIFCTPEQLENEVLKVLDLVDFMMNTFHFKYKAFLSTKPEKAVGSADVWEKAEKALKDAVEKKGLPYEVDKGEGVFYGPKIDIKLIDVLGRGWQGPTIQVDFNNPERFDINFINNSGKEEKVVMIHRTVLGSMERFLGILIEHYAGDFPLWLQPIQVIVLPVSKDYAAYASSVFEKIHNSGIRCEIDDKDDSLSKKIKSAEKRKIKYMFIVGEQEQKAGEISIRVHKKGDIGRKPADEIIESIKDEIRKKD
jgi:threonyl-tRNA synthetase